MHIHTHGKIIIEEEAMNMRRNVRDVRGTGGQKELKGEERGE